MGATTWPADSTTYTPLRFPGQYYDPETGLHYNYFRHYDPETAR
ncbi:RHS repeat-associated protein [Streptomyces calvus]|uniref:RHS repeat-associated protein n=1 Tax=Streptomyces calvus TaxID=67282 RepID=A0AA40SE74_9ACTN|nr:RHS repeat-associated protein [Streptomyces calvus]